MPTARIGDISTAWFEIGRGSPIVLIHGLADDHRLWRKLVPSLAIRHRMLLYDLRGHGQTSLGDADGSLQQLGQDLLNLLDALELETAALTGYSLGGTVAMRLAIDHPGRLAGDHHRLRAPDPARAAGPARRTHRELPPRVAAGLTPSLTCSPTSLTPLLPALTDKTSPALSWNVGAELSNGVPCHTSGGLGRCWREPC